MLVASAAAAVCSIDAGSFPVEQAAFSGQPIGGVSAVNTDYRQEPTMSACTKDAAKFFAGFAANETIAHWMLGLWGANLFPMKFLGLTFTREFNWFAMAIWPLVLVLCVYFGWRRGDKVSVDANCLVTPPARTA
jgi:hypothetical protein